MKHSNSKIRPICQQLLCIFSLLITITSINFQFRSQLHLIELLSSSKSQNQQQTLDINDQSSQVYSSFIDTLLQNQKFTTSLIQSVSNVFYNHWVVKISPQLQKKYLKILLTTVRNDQSIQMTAEENFDMLRRILDEPDMAKEFLKYLDFDFGKKEFGEFVMKYYPEEKYDKFDRLLESDKARIYLLSLQKEQELQEGKIQKYDKKEENYQEEKTKKQQINQEQPENLLKPQQTKIKLKKT